jgi:aflatoxin B1 aldehyde reductase
VDIFYLHAPDRNVPFAETLEACDKLHKEGKFVQLGLSNFTAFEVAEIVMTCKYNNWVRPTIYQGMYNAITRTLQTELIPACRRYGLDVVVYNPIAGGLFSGKYNFDELVADANKPPTEGRFSDSVGRMGPMYRERYFRPETFKALKIVEEASKKAGITLVETALRWCLHHSALRVGGIEYENGEKGNDGLVIGVSSLEQLEMNLKAVEEGKLPESVVKALDDAWAVARGGNLPNYWHLELKYGYDTRKELFGV